MSRTGAFAVPELPGCKHSHYKSEPSGYVAWFEWAEKMARTHEQKQCLVCGRWAIWKRRAASSRSAGDIGDEQT